MDSNHAEGTQLLQEQVTAMRKRMAKVQQDAPTPRDPMLNRQFVLPYLKGDGLYFYRFRPGPNDPSAQDIEHAKANVGFGGPVAMGEPELLTEFMDRLRDWLSTPKPAPVEEPQP